MSIARFCLFVSLLFLTVPLVGQTRLSDSKRISGQSLVYRLNPQDMKRIYLDEEFDDSQLHSLVGSYNKQELQPALDKLERGNYLIICTEAFNLKYEVHTVDDLFFRMIPAETAILFLYDKEGKPVRDAAVKRNSKLIHFDSNTQSYNTKKLKENDVVEINNKGVIHYILCGDTMGRWSYKPNLFQKAGRSIRSIFRSVKYWFDKDYENRSFVVFNKPKYKPGDTVKLKAYIADQRGKPYNKEVEVRLLNYYKFRVDTLLTKLQPYRPGMYEYEFALSDSLKLHLDMNYRISLRHNWDEIVGKNFRYEEYQLKGITFTINTDKTKFMPGDTVRLKAKASDENNLPVYDGRVNVTVRPVSNSANIRDGRSAFLPDLLWEETVSMDGKAEKEIVLPDSVFPEGLSFDFVVACDFYTTDNEKHSQSKTLKHNGREHQIRFTSRSGMLAIEPVYRGEKQENVKALLSIYDCDGGEIKEEPITLPATIPMLWYASEYEVITDNVSGTYDSDSDRLSLDHRLYRRADSVYLEVDNPMAIPFWYILRKGKTDIAAACSESDLRYAVKDDKSAYSLRISYLWGEREMSYSTQLPLYEKNISMDVKAPETVYPGQTAGIEVSVKDKEGRPVKNADITAYAYTNKFDSSGPPARVYGKQTMAKPIDDLSIDVDEEWLTEKMELDVDKWNQRLGLDTIEYYRFLNPRPYYSYSEPVKNAITQVAPFVIDNGKPEGIHYLYINDKLHYIRQADFTSPYSFPVKPGKYRLRMRTYDKEITVDSVEVTGGMKTIISVDASIATGKRSEKYDPASRTKVSSQLVKKGQRKKLSKKEKAIFEANLIIIENNLGIQEDPQGNKTSLPVYINSGGVVNQFDANRWKWDNTLKTSVRTPLLAGPFPYKSDSFPFVNLSTIYSGERFIANFEAEAGNRFIFMENYQKIQPWDDSPVKESIASYAPSLDFKRHALTEKEVMRAFRNSVIRDAKNKRGSISNVPANPYRKEGRCELRLTLTKDGRDSGPSFVYLIPEEKEPHIEYIYYGATRSFENLPAGNAQVILINSDTTAYGASITLRTGGINYLSIDNVGSNMPRSIGEQVIQYFGQHCKTIYPENPYTKKNVNLQLEVEVTNYFAGEGQVAGVVYDKEGKEPLIGASVILEGSPHIGTVTDFDGQFILDVPSSTGKLEISSIGMKPRTVSFRSGRNYNIYLEPDYNELQEVVIAYGASRKQAFTGAVSRTEEIDINRTLEGRVAGVSVQGVFGDSPNIRIRGAATIDPSDSGRPLIIVNGVPYEGDLSDFVYLTDADITVIKDASATSIYGSRAMNGVVVINTGSFEAGGNELFPEFQGNSLRRNFHDDAFWKPSLSTDEEGIARFDVTFPDDVTGWNTHFIAIGNKKHQMDKYQTTIRSFKTITGSLAVPEFVVRGDKVNVIGKLTNHLGNSIEVERTIGIDGAERKEKIEMDNLHVDTIPAMASQQADSLRILYSLQLANGYFDGEERLIPIYEAGTLESYGEFLVLDSDESHTLNFDPQKGSVTIHAESSFVEGMLREIEKVHIYPYECNEQLASKVKVLLSKKRIYEMLGKDFDDDRIIRSLINKLNKNLNNERLWGWWDKSQTEWWISEQVLDALLLAEEAGYDIGLDKGTMAGIVAEELDRALSVLKLHKHEVDISSAKHNLLYLLKMLKQLDAKFDYKLYDAYFNIKDDSATYNRLFYLEMKSESDSLSKPEIDKVLSAGKTTLMGSLYFPSSSLLPYNNDVNTTLMVYRILKNTGEYKDELQRIRNYFFETRRTGSWRNTYESSCIIETILPDILDKNKKPAGTSLYINDEKITQFPYTAIWNEDKALTIKKEGALPVFFTAYQQTWNNRPQKKNEGFEVESRFRENNSTVMQLTAGKSVELEVKVVVEETANYAMIEIPIPSGCAYESKRQGIWGKEIHREHFKNKVVIFCEQLNPGEHTFSVKLLPRYTGEYILNPARAELMYFPTISGQEEVKQLTVNSKQ